MTDAVTVGCPMTDAVTVPMTLATVEKIAPVEPGSVTHGDVAWVA